MQPTPSPALFACAALLVLAAGPLQADSKDDIAPPPAAPVESHIPISQEFDIEGSYSSPSEFKQGSARVGGVDDTYGHFNYVVSPQVKDGILLRFGVDGERYSFSLPPHVAMPNTLQSFSAVIGADIAVNDQILLRAEIHPGIYSDFVKVTSSDIDAPVQIGGTYLWNKDFQIIFGLEIDPRSDMPIIGAPGFRWQFADKWVLSAIPPRPQIQYLLNNAVTLYAGAEILAGTYHLNENFGNSHGNSRLNGNDVDYDEFRAGVGVTWKFTPNMSLDVSGGYVPYREYDIHPDRVEFSDSNLTFHNNLGSGGAYTEIGIKGSF